MCVNRKTNTLKSFVFRKNSNAIDELQCVDAFSVNNFKRKFVVSILSFGFVFFFFRLTLVKFSSEILTFTGL